MKPSSQVQAIVDIYFDDGLDSLDAHNFALETEFIRRTDINNLTHRTWCRRIHSAATEIGLSGYRSYNAESSASAGIPLYTMVYS